MEVGAVRKQLRLQKNGDLIQYKKGSTEVTGNRVRLKKQSEAIYSSLVWSGARIRTFLSRTHPPSAWALPVSGNNGRAEHRQRQRSQELVHI